MQDVSAIGDGINWITFGDYQSISLSLEQDDNVHLNIVCWGGPKLNEVPPKLGVKLVRKQEK